MAIRPLILCIKITKSSISLNRLASSFVLFQLLHFTLPPSGTPPPFLRPFHSEQCNIHFKLPWQAIFAPKMHINDRLNKTSFKKNLTANASEWNWLDFINAILLHTNPNLDMSRSYNKCKQCKRALILCCFALCAANTFHYSL